MYYQKVGRKYVPVGNDVAFPMDGLWAVMRDTQSQIRILPLSKWRDIDPETLAMIGNRTWDVAKYLVETRDRTAMDMALEIIELLSTRKEQTIEKERAKNE
jgi:hypothetical protein